MPKNLLVSLGAAFFVVYGVAFILAPTAMASFVTGAAPTHPTSMIDFRATYGGMTLGVGLILAICARTPAYSRLGLQSLAIAMGAMATGRVVGIVLDGEPNAMMFIYLALEFVVLALSLLGLRGDSDPRGRESDQENG